MSYGLKLAPKTSTQQRSSRAFEAHDERPVPVSPFDAPREGPEELQWWKDFEAHLRATGGLILEG